MEAGGPHTMTVEGKNKLTLTDVLIGEVWLGSGQSNMYMELRYAENGAAEVAAAKYPKMRLFHAPVVQSHLPKADTNAVWNVCTPEAAKTFSAALYFCGRHLHQELDVPVGLIHGSCPGSAIDPWIW